MHTVGVQHLSRHMKKSLCGRGILAPIRKPDRDKNVAPTILEQADILAKITDEPGIICRTFRSPAMKRANAQVAQWMREAGLTVREDPAGNLIGRLASKNPRAKTFILGSHLDTVRDAGKYDGILGVLTAIEVAGQLRDLPFNLEIYGFADEEGVRFATTYLGSGAVTGSLTKRNLNRKDAAGIALGQLIGDLSACRRNPRDLLGYAEVHIEQGPVLDQRRLAVGVVKAIAGQTRTRITFTGQAGHAGTTPMKMRRDALCAAAEFVLAVEKVGVLATVGTLEIRNSAGNVIPGHVTCSVDIRHENDAMRQRAVATLRRWKPRAGIKMVWENKSEVSAVACDGGLVKAMTQAARKHQRIVPLLVSGAGHDAAAMAAITPVVMLFVRCKDGISHNSAESVKPGDVAKAAAILQAFLLSVSEA
ncbi:MAG: N-carbamoyl-L-amino-acid hydrolase [Verrucomicrobiae bacterium]|nr:N-carbamoyl-L-amino-acid hydrolase [Verrucomicrobiae bacterium]